MEAVNGAKKRNELNVKVICDKCSGTGAMPVQRKKNVKNVPEGSVRVQRQSFFGTVVSEELCSECNLEPEKFFGKNVINVNLKSML